MNPHILLAEDDPHIREGLVAALESEGYRVTAAANGSQALARHAKGSYDLILLDVMMPEVNGFDVCRQIRRRDRTVPIIMLTAKSEEIDKVVGLELGADDYVTKPFSLRELVLRIRKLLKRSKAADEPGDHLSFGGLEIDGPHHIVKVENQPVTLTATEFRLLLILAKRRGRVQTRERLLQDVWGYDTAIETRTVDTHMRRLREKIGVAADYLETIRGVGYRFRNET